MVQGSHDLCSPYCPSGHHDIIGPKYYNRLKVHRLNRQKLITPVNLCHCFARFILHKNFIIFYHTHITTEFLFSKPCFPVF